MRWSGLVACVLLAGCASAGAEGSPSPAGHAETPAPTTSASAAPAPTLPPDEGFDYQLGGGYEPPRGTAIVARDVTDAPAQGLYSICYLNGFQSQPGEASDWDGLLLTQDGEPVADPGWPDEFLLDPSTTTNRQAIADRMTGRIAECVSKGFDAVEFDNLDSYSRSGGALTADDNLALARLYIDEAHAAGLAVAQKNAVEIARQGKAAGFDFAVAEECGRYHECGEYLEVYIIVLDIEYGDAPSFRALCAEGALPPHAILRDRNLTAPTSEGYVFERCP